MRSVFASGLQEPPAPGNGFAVLHAVTAVPVLGPASGAPAFCLREGTAIGAVRTYGDGNEQEFAITAR
jgi:hypothetical protein